MIQAVRDVEALCRAGRRLAACAAASLLASCAGAPRTASAPDADTSPYATAAPVLALSESAAGPITAETPYAPATLKALFPGITFETVQTMSEGRVVYFLTGFHDGFQTFQVEPDGGRNRVARVHVVGPAAAGPKGERIGQSYAETGGRTMSCVPGDEEWAGLAICSRSKSRVRYIYAPDLFDGTDDQLPPASVLTSARLVRMVWEAP